MTLQPDYFTRSGKQILQSAQLIAFQAQHDEITSDHLFLAMARAKDTNAYHALQEVDIHAGKLARYLKVLHPNKSAHPLRFAGVEISDEVQQIFRLSLIDATIRGDDYIASAHLLIGMMRHKSEMIQAILNHFSLEPKEVIKATEYYLEHSIEIEKTRIRVQVEDEPLGCFGMLLALVEDLTRKRKNDE